MKNKKKYIDKMSSLISGRIPQSQIESSYEDFSFAIIVSGIIREEMGKCAVPDELLMELHREVDKKNYLRYIDVGVVSVKKDPYLCSMKKLR
mgnify:CR=1 FL=1